MVKLRLSWQGNADIRRLGCLQWPLCGVVIDEVGRKSDREVWRAIATSLLINSKGHNFCHFRQDHTIGRKVNMYKPHFGPNHHFELKSLFRTLSFLRQLVSISFLLAASLTGDSLMGCPYILTISAGISARDQQLMKANDLLSPHCQRLPQRVVCMSLQGERNWGIEWSISASSSGMYAFQLFWANYMYRCLTDRRR